MSVATQGSTRNIRRESRPERHPGRMPSHLCVLVDLERTIAQVLRRIRQVHDARQCGCYLFIDRLQRVYVVTEEQPCVAGLLTERVSDLVGLYAMTAEAAGRFGIPKGVAWIAPTEKMLREDIEDHLRDRD